MKVITTYAAQTITKTQAILIALALGGMCVLLLALPNNAHAQTTSYTPLSAQIGLGSRGANVTNLQTFLAANPNIYPEGLVTGYYGTLTARAVIAFQNQFGISPVGRVGPLTLAKINSLISSGGWVTMDTTGPSFYNVSQTIGSNQTTFSFNTSENTTARVVYNSSPLMFNEGDINSNGFGPIGGSSMSSSSGLSSSHSVTIPNLAANTPYYYTIIATDQSGNVSVWGPNNSFRTNQ